MFVFPCITERIGDEASKHTPLLDDQKTITTSFLRKCCLTSFNILRVLLIFSCIDIKYYFQMAASCLHNTLQI